MTGPASPISSVDTVAVLVSGAAETGESPPPPPPTCSGDRHRSGGRDENHPKQRQDEKEQYRQEEHGHHLHQARTHGGRASSRGPLNCSGGASRLAAALPRSELAPRDVARDHVQMHVGVAIRRPDVLSSTDPSVRHAPRPTTRQMWVGFVNPPFGEWRSTARSLLCDALQVAVN
jgi:hypothetical protein